MFIIETILKESLIPNAGLGYFAKNFIPKGTIVWEYNSKFNLKITSEELNNFPKHLKEYFIKYSYIISENNQEVLIYSTDNSRFMNHSFQPNLDDTDLYCIANRDILPGEELTSNYYTYDLYAVQKLS